MKRVLLAIMAAVLLASLGAPGLQAKELILEPQKVSVITSPTESRDTRLLVYFDLPSPNENKLDFDSAFLVFRGKVTDADFGTVEVFPVTTDWKSAGTPSWGSPWHTAGGDFTNNLARGSVTLKSANADEEVRLNVTLIVKAWVDGVLPNNGIVILGSQGDLKNSDAKFGIKPDNMKLKIIY
jgi:hypothetical protein